MSEVISTQEPNKVKLSMHSSKQPGQDTDQQRCETQSREKQAQLRCELAMLIAEILAQKWLADESPVES